MTDQDRGAYTPQTDAPLAFDARHSRGGGGGGGPAPMTLIVSAIVLLLLIIALLLVYRSGVRHAGQAPQVVGAPVAQTKTAPASSESAAPGAGAGLQIYKSNGTSPPPSAAPTFAPAPEQPEARPAPPPAAAPVAPVASAPLRPAQSVAPAAAPPAPEAEVAPAAPRAVTSPTPALAAPAKAAAASSAKPKPAVAAAKAAPSASAPVAGEPLVQIGAFSSAALAEKGWNDTALVLPGKMAGRTSKVEKADRDGKTFYRAFVGGFSSHADAVSFCASLKAAGKPCMVR